MTCLYIPASHATSPTLDYSRTSRIAWSPFTETTQQRAQASNKALFVYFHAQWCTWCRTYQHETLELPSVAAAIQRRFVPVLVDAERRRDLFTRYGGRGLPYTVISDAQGQMLFRFTGHVSPNDLMDLIQRQYKRPATHADVASQTLPAEPQAFLNWLEDLYDPATARFLNPSHIGSTGKRPQPLSLIYLLDEPTWQPRMTRIIDALLDDLQDKEEGGFYFFADRTRPELTIPVETSKVLGLNAQIIWLLAEAYQRHGHARWKAAAEHGIAYLEQALWDPREGGFFGSQASDAAYHALPLAQRKARPTPMVEHIKYTDSNSMAALALLRAGVAFNESRHTQRALQTLTFLDKRLRAPDKGYFHYIEQDRPRLSGYLPDQAWSLAAYYAAHKQHLLPSLQRVRQLETVIDTYQDSPAGGYFERLDASSVRWKDHASNGLIAWLWTQSESPQRRSAVIQSAIFHSRLPEGGQPDDLALAMLALRSPTLSK